MSRTLALRRVTFPLFVLSMMSVGAVRAEPDEAVDRITVKGQTLEGRIEALQTGYVEMETSYGEGAIHIPFEDVEGIETATPMRIYYGPLDDTASGRLVGIEDDAIVLEAADGTRSSIPLADVNFGIPKPSYDESLLQRLRSDFREWNLEIDLSVDIEQGNLEETKVRFAGRVDRRRKPLRLLMQLNYATDAQQLGQADQQITKDELNGVAFVERSLPHQFVATGIVGGEFDRPRSVESRIYPTLGVGYRIFDTTETKLTPTIGIAYVREDFVDLARQYPATYIGLEGSHRWNPRTELRLRLTYWVGLDGTSDGLYRSELNLTYRIWDPIGLRTTILWVNDDNPSINVGTNKFQTILGLTLLF